MRFLYKITFIFLVITIIFSHNESTHVQTVDASINVSHFKSRNHELWHEINDSIVINCSLKVNKDQHVVWHRKYDKMAVHVLTIGSETFISDLRIRPIKQIFDSNAQDEENFKLTWNLEIRRLKRDDSAIYYCVLNSENAYGQNYKLNVLPQLKFMNKSDMSVFNEDKPTKNQNQSNRRNQIYNPLILMCKYDDILSMSQTDQIKWYFNKNRIRTTGQMNNDTEETEPNKHHYTILQNVDHSNNSTISKLIIHNFDSRLNHGKYRCAYKGLIKTVRISSDKMQDDIDAERLVYKQSIFSMLNSSSKLVFNFIYIYTGFFIFNLF